jgi:hypothetical protein
MLPSGELIPVPGGFPAPPDAKYAVALRRVMQPWFKLSLCRPQRRAHCGHLHAFVAAHSPLSAFQFCQFIRIFTVIAPGLLCPEDRYQLYAPLLQHAGHLGEAQVVVVLFEPFYGRTDVLSDTFPCLVASDFFLLRAALDCAGRGPRLALACVRFLACVFATNEQCAQVPPELLRAALAVGVRLLKGPPAFWAPALSFLSTCEPKVGGAGRLGAVAGGRGGHVPVRLLVDRVLAVRAVVTRAAARARSAAGARAGAPGAGARGGCAVRARARRQVPPALSSPPAAGPRARRSRRRRCRWASTCTGRRTR